ncbi:MAG TPA: glycosyltransferase family 2 protein [Ignavibacteria bacterium]|nr:glycosyltransferase family 2 protein [Ignavibacteria bacterium]
MDHTRKRFYYKKKKKPVDNTSPVSEISSGTDNPLNPSETLEKPVDLHLNTSDTSVKSVIQPIKQSPPAGLTNTQKSPIVPPVKPIVQQLKQAELQVKTETQNKPKVIPNRPVRVHHPQRVNVRKPQIQNNENTGAVRNNQMISVVIPLYNEEESLKELSSGLGKVFEHMRCNYEVIFIDDGSTDNSFAKIKEINRKNPRFHCIKLRRNYGKSAALAKGFIAAKGSIVITMDADLQDDPEEIPELVKVLNSGFDLVSGWKKIRYDPFIKKHTSKFFNYFTSKLSGIKLHDFNCGLKAYKKEVVKSLNIYGEMHRYIPALAYLSGFKVTEKPVKHHSRKYGVTKFGASRFINGFLDLLTVVFTNKYMKRPLHFFGSIGMISSFAGFVISLYLVILKFFEGKPLSDRPLFLIGIFLIIVGVQFMSLGLIAEMITKTNYKDDDILIEITI